jgi:hypothetical protein
MLHADRTASVEIQMSSSTLLAHCTPNNERRAEQLGPLEHMGRTVRRINRLFIISFAFQMLAIVAMMIASRRIRLGSLLLCLSACLDHGAEANRQAYFTVTEDDLGRRDYLVSNGNPMKGLIANPEWAYDPNVSSIDSSMDIYYVPVGKVMRDDPNMVGNDAAFDWSYVEDRLAASGDKGRHVVLTFGVHYPGQPLSLPGHLEGSDKVQLQ